MNCTKENTQAQIHNIPAQYQYQRTFGNIQRSKKGESSFSLIEAIKKINFEKQIRIRESRKQTEQRRVINVTYFFIKNVGKNRRITYLTLYLNEIVEYSANQSGKFLYVYNNSNV